MINACLLFHGHVRLMHQEGECTRVYPQHDMSFQVCHILLATVDVVFWHRKAEGVVIEARLIYFTAEDLVAKNEEVDEHNTEEGHEEVVARSDRRETIHQIVRDVTVTTQVLHKEQQMDVHPKSISVSICMPKHQPSQVFEHDNRVVCKSGSLV